MCTRVPGVQRPERRRLELEFLLIEGEVGDALKLKRKCLRAPQSVGKGFMVGVLTEDEKLRMNQKWEGVKARLEELRYRTRGAASAADLRGHDGIMQHENQAAQLRVQRSSSTGEAEIWKGDRRRSKASSGAKAP